MAEATKPVTKVLIIMAMAHEAASVIQKFGLQEVDKVKAGFAPKAQLLAYEGKLEQGSIYLVTNGQVNVYEQDGKARGVKVERVSVTPAAISAWEGIRVFNPDVVLSVGTAGGSKERGAKLRGIYLASHPVRYFDRLIDFRAPGDDYPVCNYKCYGIGNYPVLPTPNLVKALNLSTAVVATGSSFAAPEGNIKEQFEAIGVVIKEMEAAAIAEVAESLSVPFLAVKGVSDWFDVHIGEAAASEEFANNLGPVSDDVAETTLGVVKFILGKTLAEL